MNEDFNQKPFLLIVRGIPGSGKSYLVRAIEQQLGAQNVVILDPDNIDQSSHKFQQFSQQLTAQGIANKFHAYRFLREQAYAAILANKIIIWNQAFIDFSGFEITVKRLQDFAAEHSIQLPVLVAEVEIAEAVALQRVTARERKGKHIVPVDVLERFIQNYTSFAGKGYVTVTLNGEDPVDQKTAAVLTAMTNLN